MIKHVVLFKFKSFSNDEEKNTKCEEIKNALLALDNKIEELLSIEVGINSNPNESFDLSLITTFNSMEALHTYAVHPDHLKVGAIIREILEERSCVDYTI
ncbi:Dabb family protein [Marinilabiliaceae bacterium JC017]|nr:Dabb family protein [Marinilabiliaceae bacterium JC017]